jgi:uncharacterized protein YndB with AHSA1/START domain
MTDRSVTHATFVIDRTFDASPTRVFRAFADPMAKKRWFNDHEQAGPNEYELDFRVGGREFSRGAMPDGPSYVFDAYIQDIVPDQRIVTTYYMLLNEQRISVSVATVEFKPEGAGTRLVFTEQGAYLDGYDTPEQREHGTRELLDSLDAELRRTSAAEVTR